MFEGLQGKLMKVYRMEGFKKMVRNNPNMTAFFGQVQSDLIREG